MRPGSHRSQFGGTCLSHPDTHICMRTPNCLHPNPLTLILGLSDTRPCLHCSATAYTLLHTATATARESSSLRSCDRHKRGRTDCGMCCSCRCPEGAGQTAQQQAWRLLQSCRSAIHVAHHSLTYGSFVYLFVIHYLVVHYSLVSVYSCIYSMLHVYFYSTYSPE